MSKILIIDDEVQIRTLLARMMELGCFETIGTSRSGCGVVRRLSS